MRGKLGQGAGEFGTCDDAFPFQYRGKKCQPVTVCLNQRFDLEHPQTVIGETL